MANQDTERVRQVLEALLRRLEATPNESGEDASSLLLSAGVNGSTPVIVVLGGPNSSPQHATHCNQCAEGNERPAAAMSNASAYGEPPAIHPGLERFLSAETEPSSAAPKPCFIEPGRACVSSGACEMRGY